MEYRKIINLLDTKSDNVPRFVTQKWVEVHHQSGESYSINNQIRFKTSMLRSVITVLHILLSKELLRLKEQIIETGKIGL